MANQLGVPVPGGTLTAWVDGEGDDVLVLHGGPGLSDYTASLVDELGPGRRAVRFQQRGLPPSLTDGPFSIERHAADAVAVIDAAGMARPVVVGHSWGGYLALHLLRLHPDRFAGAVVVDPLGALGDGGAADMDRVLAERASQEAQARLAELAARAGAGDVTEADALETVSLLWPGYFPDPPAAPPMPALRRSSACSAGTWESIRAHMEARTLEHDLPAVEVPVVFVLGAGSPIPTHHGVASAGLLSRAQVVVEEGCGHFPWLDRPGTVRAALNRLG